MLNRELFHSLAVLGYECLGVVILIMVAACGAIASGWAAATLISVIQRVNQYVRRGY